MVAIAGLGLPNFMEMDMPNVEIKVKGCLDEHWSEWFNDFEISLTEENETVLKGEVKDQPALYGLIAKLRDLGLSLVAVKIIAGLLLCVVPVVSSWAVYTRQLL